MALQVDKREWHEQLSYQMEMEVQTDVDGAALELKKPYYHGALFNASIQDSFV